jgi:ATP-binding cassette, subfamily B, bacterial
VHPVFALVFFSWICVFCAISVVFSGDIAKEYSVDYSRNKSKLAGNIVDTITNISSVRTFVNHIYERSYINKYITLGIDSETSMQWFIFKLRYVLGLTCTIMIFFMLYYASLLKADNKITIGDVALIITLCLAVADNIWNLMREVSDLLEEIGTFMQSISIIEFDLLEDDENAQDLVVREGRIDFNDVTFEYQHNNNIFASKTVSIKGGQKVGLVGYSGSGKTTFVNLINRLYNIESGAITIDGIDIKNVTQDSLRNNISIIPQDPILFDRTIKENIGYAKIDATDEEIYRAARLAHIHDEIMLMPEKYDTICGQRGTNLSGGQKKRIAIARAILKNAPILILDEANSALDGVTEELIRESLKTLMQGKTVIVIAHILSIVLDMDRILFFDKGQIIEDGTHKQLLQDKQLYYKLWNSYAVVL